MINLELNTIKVRFIFSLILSVIVVLHIPISAEEKDSTSFGNNILSIAYDSRKFMENTASVSAVSGEDLYNPVTSLSNTLYGKIPGLTTVFNSGEPGNDAASLFIRGRGTFNNNDLLVYVDGFPSGYEHIKSSEIESISILKDAAALVSFGIEGANGVIWITTKRGETGKLKISFQNKFGYTSPGSKHEFLSSYDYARLYNEANSNDNGMWSPIYSDDDLSLYKNGLDPILHPDVNWYDEVISSNAPFYDASLTFSGGNSTVRYAVLLGFQDFDMLYKNNPNANDGMRNTGSFSKYNFRANTDIKINKIFSLSTNLSGAVTDKTIPTISTSTLWGNLASYPSNIYPIKNDNGVWGGSALYLNNPVADMFAAGQKTTHDRIIQSSVVLKQDLSFFIDGLSLSEAVSFNDYFEGYYNKTKSYERNQPFLNEGVIEYISFNQNTDYSVSDGTGSVWNRINYFVSADYNKSIFKNNLSVKLAFKQDQFVQDGRNAPYFKQGVFGHLKYNHNNKYISEFGFSYSGSENFMKGHRFGFFPALSTGWVISNEDFLSNYDWIDLLKIRASAGVIGNDNIGQRFLFQSYYGGNIANSYIFGYTANTSQNTLAEKIVGNPSVTWEKSKKINFGIDFFAMKKFSFIIDLFYENRSDIITQRKATVTGVYGNILPYENIGIVVNKGVELESKYKDNIGELNYEIGGQFSFVRNRIKYQDEIVRSEKYLYRTGKQVGQPFGLECVGFYELEDFDEKGRLIDNLSVPSFPVQSGDLKYKDQNNDGYINEDDQIAIGNTYLPEITYSFNIMLKYRKLDFKAFFYGVANRSVYLNGSYIWAFANNSNAPAIANGRWAYYPEQGIDTRAIATYPRLTTQSNDHNFQRSTFWTRDGSFLKLGSVELGYLFPQKISDFLNIRDCRFYLGGSNLITWDKITGYDSESLTGYPLTKNYYIGFNINF